MIGEVVLCVYEFTSCVKTLKAVYPRRIFLLIGNGLNLVFMRKYIALHKSIKQALNILK